jgi:hypothetical protein
LTEQLFPLDLELPLPYRAPHEFRDNRTLILITEGLVKCRLNVVGNTKVNGGHGLSPLLKFSTIKLYASISDGQSRSQWIFVQYLSSGPHFGRPNRGRSRLADRVNPRLSRWALVARTSPRGSAFLLMI